MPWRQDLYTTYAQLGATVALVLLLLLALQRLLFSAAPQLTRRHSLIECCATLAAVITLALPQSQTAFPWLVMMACLFPLILSGRPMLGVVTAVGLAGVLLNLFASASTSDLLSQFFVTLFAGSIGILLSEALRFHLVTARKSRINLARFNAIARVTHNLFIITDADFKVLFVNRAIKEIIGYTQNEILGNALPSSIHPDDLAAYQKNLRALHKLPNSTVFTRYRLQHKNGHWIWLEAYGYNMLHDEAINGFVFSIVNITERKLAEQKLDDERTLLRAVLDHNPSMMYATDLTGRFTISNQSFQRRFGFLSEEDLRGKTSHDVMRMQATNMQKHIARQLAHESQLHDIKIMQNGEPVQSIEIEGILENEAPRWYKSNKYPLRDSNGKIIGILNTMRDITRRKEYEIHLKYQALHDPLTGLANRRYMLQSIARSMELFRTTGEMSTILFCDLDFFKNVNDIHGHEFGDKCLREITRRINLHLNDTDFAARFGSDEFIILVKAAQADAKVKAQALLQALSVPLIINDVVVKVGASIGIARMRADHKNPSELIRDADAAMYQAKEQGRNRIEIFDASLHDISTRRAQLDAALHFALERNEFSILYQPKVSMRDGSLKGLELLLRWNSPQHGEISPTEFIPIAESNGLIVPIGLWALEQACKQQRHWQTAFPDAGGAVVAVNVSMRQLLQSAFLPAVTRILEESGVTPGTIELELTETSVMASPLQVIENLALLKRLGLRLALDDFGTGYSSLAYLQKLPINTLKIDKAFVTGIAKRKSDKEIVRLIIALARTLALEIVAEGVETQEQVVELSRLGCEIGQGFLFSPPIGAPEVERWLAMQEDRRTEIAPEYIRID
ncbi:EAL domain-containing protein [Herminiimonas sp. CN]|uniref:sensor domain-containing protein n=1 Tax=Herminiimonas sp. CN TaxID=1349818 RepID=UPI001EE64128|nr:EAL domain-containing protein [Herminiimonas sp. CN]